MDDRYIIDFNCISLPPSKFKFTKLVNKVWRPVTQRPNHYLFFGDHAKQTLRFLRLTNTQDNGTYRCQPTDQNGNDREGLQHCYYFTVTARSSDPAYQRCLRDAAPKILPAPGENSTRREVTRFVKNGGCLILPACRASGK